MPLPNGVDPWGRIHPTCRFAGWMGNRGVLHDERGTIGKRWQHSSWVICALHFKGRSRRPLMQPNRYTELFFLDEATALAAGHRPCGECRRSHYRALEAFLPTANSQSASMDGVLHRARIDHAGNRRTFASPARVLPDGAMFERDSKAMLVWKGRWLEWSPTGYATHGSVDVDDDVPVLTPEPLVQALRNGYRVQVHGSAERP